MILIQRVDFEYKLIEFYNEEFELIVIVLGKVRITVYKDWRIKDDYRCKIEGGLYSSTDPD